MLSPCSQLSDGTTPAEDLHPICDVRWIFWTEQQVRALSAPPGFPQDSSLALGSLRTQVSSAAWAERLLEKAPGDAQLQKPTAVSFQGPMHFTRVKLASPWAQLSAESWEFKKYLVQTSYSHLCIVTLSLKASDRFWSQGCMRGDRTGVWPAVHLFHTPLRKYLLANPRAHLESPQPWPAVCTARRGSLP